MVIHKECKEILMGKENIIFAYIFGSYVRDKLRNTSDIDIGIYIKNKMSTDEYLGIKMELTRTLEREVDLVILNDATPLLKYEVYKNHQVLFSKDRVLESNYKVKTLFEYNDMKRYLDLSYNKTIERLRNEVDIHG